MTRLTWEDKDGGIFVDGTDCYELDLEGCVTVCSGEAIVKLAKYEDYNEPKPIDEWDEDYGDCLWWKFPIEEPPYCGSPLDKEWEDDNYDSYYTHFTRLVIPELN